MRSREQIMDEWDAIRAKIAGGCMNSGPRDWFEGVMDDQDHENLCEMLDESEAREAKLKQHIAQLELALRGIIKMKSEPIGNSGFSVGPLALFQNCRRLARSALKGANK